MPDPIKDGVQRLIRVEVGRHIDLDCRFDKPEHLKASYETLVRIAEQNFSGAAAAHGLPIVADWNDQSTGRKTIPEDVASQILGRIYEPPMCIDYLGQHCVVTKIEAESPDLWDSPSQGLDDLKWMELAAELSSKRAEPNIMAYFVEPGRLIPVDAKITILQLISADALQGSI